tara:strand:- start:1405 stop:1563 length:159 start_codon:yes stop_codon:yes gene_type:complete
MNFVRLQQQAPVMTNIFHILDIAWDAGCSILKHYKYTMLWKSVPSVVAGVDN